MGPAPTPKAAQGLPASLLHISKGWGWGCGLIACNMSIDRHQVGQSRATGLIIINDGLFGRNAHHSAVIKDEPSTLHTTVLLLN